MKIKFRKVKLSPGNKARLDVINRIITEYQNAGYVLTLRQLYYQLVSRDVIPNQQKEYAKLSSLLKEGRMGGIVDWDAIEDRLRQPYVPNEFEDTKEAIKTIHDVYRLPRMRGQSVRVECWVEKDALSGVLKRVTSKYHVPILVNRGYSSASAMFDSYERFSQAISEDKKVTILYLGDFDPSGLDMIRDIKERTREFLLKDYLENQEPEDEKELGIDQRTENFLAWFENSFEIVPIALTREQIEEYDPPPNPAKKTDPRAKDFIDREGSTSWEVDALRPEVLNQILTDAIEERIDLDVYNKLLKEEQKGKAELKKIMDKM